MTGYTSPSFTSASTNQRPPAPPAPARSPSYTERLHRELFSHYRIPSASPLAPTSPHRS